MLLGGIALFFCAYCLIGIPNFSARRGYMIPEIQTMFLFGLQVVVFSIFLSNWIMRDKKIPASNKSEKYNSDDYKIWRKSLILILLFPSFVALPYLISLKGLSFLKDDRFGTDPIIHLSILIGFLPLSLSIYNMRVAKEANIAKDLLYYFIILWFIFGSIVLGYRNSLVGIMVCYIAISMEKFSIRKVFPYAIIGAILIVGIDIYRRTNSTSLLDLQSLQEKYHATDIPQFFAGLHFTFREGFGISQRLILNYGQSPYGIFFADLLTLLPGEQLSGGRLVANLAGSTVQEGGLTTSLIGLSMFEFGLAGGCAFLALISVMFSTMIGWQTPDDRLSEGLLMGIPTYEFLLLFHRGDMRVYSYFLLFSIVLVVYFRKSRLLRTSVRRKRKQAAFLRPSAHQSVSVTE